MWNINRIKDNLKAAQKTKWVLFFLFCFVIIFFRAEQRPLSEPDEMKYFEIVREMEEGQNLFVPTYNYQPYLEKGPLFFYLLLFSVKIFSDPTQAAIFPSQIFSFFSLLSFFFLLKVWKWQEIKIAQATGILLLSGEFFIHSRICRMDSVLSFFVIAAYLILFLHLQQRLKLSHILFGILLGLSLLTKGPVSLIWFWGVPITYAFFQKEKMILSFVFHPVSLAASTCLVLAWLIPAISIEGTNLLQSILVQQTKNRMFHSFTHARPFYYYLYILPLVSLPFMVYFIFGFLRKLNRAEETFLQVWFWFPFVLFSLISGKLPSYLLPLFPCIACFASKWFDKENEKPLLHVLASLSLLISGIAFLVILNRTNLPPLNTPGQALAGMMIIGGILLLLWAIFRISNFFYPFFLFTLFLYLYPFQNFARIVIPLGATYQLSQDYTVFAKAQDLGYAFGELRPTFLYCSRKRFILIKTPIQLQQELNQGNFILIKDKYWKPLPSFIKENVQIVESCKRLQYDYYIIHKRPD